MGHRVQSCPDAAQVIGVRALTGYSSASFADRSLAAAEAGLGEPQPRRAASIAAMSIFFIPIIAANARWATAGSGSEIAVVKARGVICHDKSPLVLAPAARAFLATVSNNRVPQAVRFSLVVRRNLKRKSLAVLERGSPIQAQAGDTHHSELDRQDIALFACGIVTGRAMDSLNCAVGKRIGVERCSVQRGAVVPETNRVLVDQVSSPESR